MLRDILYKASLLGMANGEYVFITMELFPSDWLGFYTNFLRGNLLICCLSRAEYHTVYIQCVSKQLLQRMLQTIYGVTKLLHLMSFKN